MTEKKNFILDGLSKLTFRMKLEELSLKDLTMDYDASSLNPSTMWNSIYPKIESGHAYAPDLNDELVRNFGNQTFQQESAIFKIKYHNPSDLIFQHLPVKEKVKIHDIILMQNDFLNDNLTSGYIKKIVKIGVTVVQIYEGDVYRENSKISIFRRVKENLLNLGNKI